MKTSELQGAELDYWVARAMGAAPESLSVDDGEGGKYQPLCRMGSRPFSPSCDWSQAGPIIERERIDINTTVYGWEAFCDVNDKQSGSTALQAAMRAYVYDKFGDEVEDRKEPL